MAANDAVSMNVAENRQNVPMAIQENRAAVPMTVAEGGGTPGGLNRKADKVTGAVAGNLAGLDANGNLTDSGKAPGDFLEAPATAGSEGQVLTADGEGGASWQDPTGGDPTEIIDDNAGSGDTDKVWSADKSHALLTEINSKADKTVTDALQKNKAPVIIDSATGNPIVLTDGADGLPVESMKIHFLPKQDTSGGDPSPSHVCPISGWSGVTAWRTGKNLLKLDESAMVSKGWNRIFPVSLKAGTYIISCQNQFGASTNKGASVNLTDENDTTIIVALTSGYTFGDSVFLGATVNITEDQANKIKNIRFALRASGATYNDITQGDIQLELGSTASHYAEYTGQSYPVTFPDGQTVYGGTLDAVNGVLTVDRASVDLGSITWVYNASADQPFMSSNLIASLVKKPSASSVVANIVCSTLKTVSAYSIYMGTSTNGIGIHSNGDICVVYENMPTDINDFRTAVNGWELVYELATPYEIQLDPITVQTLIGDNTIWSDANGDIELDYRADTKLFIAKLKTDIRATIAPIEDGATASQAYSAGKFFYHDGQFCKAKTSIAAGATFTLNTNYQITTVADELFALN